jgi:two-component system chemotaxis response regulator CheV
MARDSILLESGTNEVEVLEFLLLGQSFGVNVLKIQAIEQYDPARVTGIPLSHHAVMGMFLFRDHTIPLIDLAAEMELRIRAAKRSEEQEIQNNRIVLVMEFNGMTTAFLVDGVNRIHRVGWDKISPLSSVLADSTADFTGSVNLENREVLIVDIEKIVAGILPQARMEYLQDHDLEHPKATSRPEVKIVLAEDSNAIRAMITSVLQKGQYTNIRDFDNGQAAYDYLCQCKQQADAENQPLTNYVTVLISDIEMPSMDGLTLCRQVRKELGQDKMPVVMFSSLINTQSAEKCRAVGASAWISKPQMGELVSKLDQMCLEDSAAA